MSYYAKVVSGVVKKVISAEADFFNSFIDDSPGSWVKTSYNMVGGKYLDSATRAEASDQSVVTGDEARERKNFAGVGYIYDGTGFYAPQPYNSWTLNTTSYLWEAPIDYPADGNDYVWDEDAYQADNTTGWVLLED